MPIETAHCRIRRVRMKNGADVTVLRRDAANGLGHTLMAHAREIATIQGDGMTGFFVVAWDEEGAYSSGTRVNAGIPQTLLPSWLAEVARRELVTTTQIRQVIEAEYLTPRSPIA